MLLIGGLFGPVRLRWVGFHERATTRTFAFTVMTTGPLFDSAEGETKPFGRRGSVPSRV